MPIEDLMNLPEDVRLSADVCLVGSGPAAWTLSKELSDAGIRVRVLESGASRLADDTSALHETEDVGMPLFNGRSRIFGGSTEASGWRNRCTRFDDIDYERRSWVPHSGWPFGPEEVEPYLRSFVGGFALSAKVQRDEGLLNRTAWLMEDAHVDDPIFAAFRLVQRPVAEGQATAGLPANGASVGEHRKDASRPGEGRCRRSWRRNRRCIQACRVAAFDLRRSGSAS